MRHRCAALRIAALVAVLALAGIAATPASATLTGPGVDAGRNITVFHNIDMVILSGWPAGATVTADVIRNGVTIGTTTGPTVTGPEGTVLEINHGPEGAPADGDCWAGHTPDILPGDRIVVSFDPVGLGNQLDVSEVTVDSIHFAGGPVLQPNGDVVVRGFARRFDGTPIPIAQLDSAEFRETQFRGAPHQVLRTPGTADGFTLVYHPPYLLDRNSDGLDQAQRLQALLGEGHSIGFGHVDPLPLESMLVEGITDVPSAALGCEGSPAQSNGVTAADDRAVNLASGDLAVSGTKMADADSVSVSVASSGGGATAPVAASVTGDRWSATIPRAALAGVGDGTLTVRGAFNHGGTAIGGRAIELGKDTVAPTIAADRASGAYTAPVSVGLTAGPGEQITFRTDGQRLGANDSAYSGPIALPVGTTTLAARATDPAGNVTDATFTYTVSPAPVTSATARRASLIARSLRLARRVTLSGVRRRGLAVSFIPPRGARVALVRLLRQRGARRTLIARRVLRVRAGRRARVRIRSRRFVPGTYVLEVRVGASRATLGRPSIARTRILRR
jgi:Chitobiase/beta-hexosaminidase C-terminal domain